jgi:hypothetical protein
VLADRLREREQSGMQVLGSAPPPRLKVWKMTDTALVTVWRHVTRDSRCFPPIAGHFLWLQRILASAPPSTGCLSGVVAQMSVWNTLSSLIPGSSTNGTRKVKRAATAEPAQVDPKVAAKRTALVDISNRDATTITAATKRPTRNSAKVLRARSFFSVLSKSRLTSFRPRRELQKLHVLNSFNKMALQIYLPLGKLETRFLRPLARNLYLRFRNHRLDRWNWLLLVRKLKGKKKNEFILLIVVDHMLIDDPTTEFSASVQPAPLPPRDIDLDDVDDPQCCTTYVMDIFNYLREVEVRAACPRVQLCICYPRDLCTFSIEVYIQSFCCIHFRIDDSQSDQSSLQVRSRPERFTLDHQREVTPKMRSILVDWLVDVAEEYRLTSETLFLAVNYLDRYLSLANVTRSELQLVGIVCCLIARYICLLFFFLFIVVVVADLPAYLLPANTKRSTLL